MIAFKNDGDLGRARRLVTPLELQLLIPHIAEIMEAIKGLNPDLCFSHAFEVPNYVKDEALIVIMTARLPPNVKFYETDGNKLFEVRGASGGVVTSMVCYLITT